MSLFPAYALEEDPNQEGLEMQVEEASPTLEARLLASEDEEEPSPAAHHLAAVPTSAPALDSFYLDHKCDYGNLRVSTLYYPGRPQYTWGDKSALGGVQTVSRGRKRRARRYFDAAAAAAVAGAVVAGAGAAADESAERVAAFKRMLADAPDDVDLWLKFIRFKERCVSGEAALAAAAEACARAPRSAALRHARLALARTQLPADRYLALLRDLIAKEKCAGVRCELWSRLVWALVGASAGVGAGAAQALAAALHDTRALASAYPRLLYAYGSYLRAAGLWELLILLIELVAAMSLPPCPAFPPAADPARDAALEKELQDIEDEVANSGLPLPARWVRVERARAAAHWRAEAGGAGGAGADPQRRPRAAALAAVLRPATAPAAARLLLLRLLQLAKVPLLPGAGSVQAGACAGAWEAPACAEALLPLLRAARRLPAAHPARAPPRAAAALLALLADPPHYFTDHHGYLSWVSALWEACCGWAAAGAARLAVLCWRLRFLHTLLLLVDAQEEAGRLEAQRIRKEARAALRTHAGQSSLPFVQFARIELVASGKDAAKTVALHAAKAALRDSTCPDTYKLYTARALSEIAGLNDPISKWVLICAVLGERLPSDEHLAELPPEKLIEAALEKCESKCAEFEEQYCRSGGKEEEEEEEGGWGALLPREGEWAGARALLAGPRRRHQLFLRAVQRPPRADLAAAATRFWEQAACALVSSAQAHHSAAVYARLLAPHYPHNAYLAVASSGAPLWSLRNASDASDTHTCLRETEVGALAEILPPLLRAVEEWRGGEAGPGAGRGAGRGACARRAARVCRRVARAGGGGAVAWAALLEAAARADCPHTQPLHALYAALDDCPQHKWLYVRGAAWCAREGGALADLLLHRQLRLHALPDELPDTAPRKPAPAPPPPPPPPPAPPALAARQ